MMQLLLTISNDITFLQRSPGCELSGYASLPIKATLEDGSLACAFIMTVGQEQFA
jgi:hypothetical protein